MDDEAIYDGLGEWYDVRVGLWFVTARSDHRYYAWCRHQLEEHLRTIHTKRPVGAICAKHSMFTDYIERLLNKPRA